MSRPLMQLSIHELEQMVDRNLNNSAELKLVESELRHRTTQAALSLRDRIEHHLKQASQTAQPARQDIPAEVRAWAYEAVAKLRAKLIDLSRRSPLIAFKHSTRSASILRFVDERPDLLYKALTEGTMEFEPLPGEDQTPPDEKTPEFQIAYEKARLTDVLFQEQTENLGDEESDARAWQQAERDLRARVRGELGLPKLEYGKGIDVKAVARAHGFDPSFELKMSDDGHVAAHHEDDHIRVLLTQKELDKRLKTIWDRAGMHLRETGLHTLFLAFGFVQWFEDDASDLPQHAPLLLLPVSLHREVRRGRYEYTLRALEDGLEVNVALIEKAREHWGLTLPDPREDELPESYFVRAKLILEKGRRLSFKNYITLAVLPPMILWRDLDPANWPEDAFAAHRLLPGLIGATKMEGASSLGDTIDIDDPDNEGQVPALITDADASQHSAIIDMAAGQDLAIEGPPGTGKSQTITNMIATALSQGKKVLFVAEKQAALQVVSNRLRDAGFGPFLLELHGDRANRAEVYAGIKERLDARPANDLRRLEEKREELRRHRSLIRQYLGLLWTPLGKLGRTTHDLVWREIRLRQQFEDSEIRAMSARWMPADPTALTRAEIEEKREILSQFGRALLALEPTEGSETRTLWIGAKKLDPFDRSDTLAAAREAANAARHVAALGDQLAGLGLQFPAPNGDVSGALLQLAAVKPFACQDEQVLRAALTEPVTVRQLLSLQSDLRGLVEELSPSVSDPQNCDAEQVAELQAALSIEGVPATLSSTNDQLQSMRSLLASIERKAEDIQALIDRVRAGPSLMLSDGATIAKTFGALVGLSANARAVVSISLVEYLTGLAIDKAVSEAQDLRREREGLQTIFASQAFEASPPELDETADLLEQTGFFGRIFNGQFKRRRELARKIMLVDEPRPVAAESIRRLARFLRAKGAFYEECKVRSLFPAILWDGIDSDFDALQSARQTLLEAGQTLEALREPDILTRWLNLTSTEQSSLAKMLAGLESELANGGRVPLSDPSLGSFADSLKGRIASLERLRDAANAVGANPESPLLIGDETLAGKLAELLAASAAFEGAASIPQFEWVAGPTQPLDSLAASLAAFDELAMVSGPMDLRAAFAEGQSIRGLQEQIDNLCSPLHSAVDGWNQASEQFDSLCGLAHDLIGQSKDWQTLGDCLATMAADSSGAGLVADLLRYKAQLDQSGLGPFAQAALENEQQPTSLPELFELLAISALVRSFIGNDGAELGRLGSLSLDDARRNFKKVDKELHTWEAQAIKARRLDDRPPMGVGYGRKSDYTEFELINHEVNLKRPRTPMRDVVRRAGAALQTLKPVWMMSPTSVAQYVQSDGLQFDVLIVDEASQMRPEFAVSSVLRASQFVVVGDANQLPPSDHFQIGTLADDDDGVGVDENTESILDLANQKFRQKRRLRWHYRSQHESLIQFSNREFYEQDLVVFPSPSGDADELLGVKCVYVPSLSKEAVYESSINQKEAERTIEEAFGLMRSHPERSIGIVAMNAKQTELIKNEFDRLVLEENHVREYVQSFAGTIEEFFIKNLENVQGDERDIIIISSVYGPGKDGKVRQNFGLLNREVGWRRLNVLVTRAKMSCRLITSLRPEDIKITENSSKGLIAFKSYLTYAHGGAQYQDATGGEPDSDFEIFVADALRGVGYEVVYQVGVAGFRIDLGVKHPDYPAGFVAGVECDGAPFHSGLSVRDRDHIRQSVLEGMGWNIYRVWSTDWFQDSRRETAKLIAWLELVKNRLVRELPGDKPTAPPAFAIEGQRTEDPVTPAPEEPTVADTTPSASTNFEAVPSGPREPRGKEMRKIGEFEWYEAIRGRLYEIWCGNQFVGEVEVLKRASQAPRLYGDHVIAAQSEYEGRLEGSADYFTSYDLYAAVREVAARATNDPARSDAIGSMTKAEG